MIKPSTKTKMSGGFTLLELVVVIGLLAVAFGVTTDILISLVRSQAKTQTLTSLEQQANFVSLKLEKDLKNAINVGVSGDVLTITKKSVTAPVKYRRRAVPLPSGNVYFLERMDDDNNWYPVTDTTNPGGVTVICPGTGCFSVSGANPKTLSFSFTFQPVATGGLVVNTGSVEIKDTSVIRSTY